MEFKFKIELSKECTIVDISGTNRDVICELSYLLVRNPQIRKLIAEAVNFSELADKKIQEENAKTETDDNTTASKQD